MWTRRLRHLLPCLALSVGCGEIKSELTPDEPSSTGPGGATSDGGASPASGGSPNPIEPQRASGGSQIEPPFSSGGASPGGASGGDSSGGASSGGGSWGGAPSGGAPNETPWDLEGQAFEFVPEGELSSSCVDGCQPLSLLFERVEQDSLQIVWGSKGRAQRFTLTPVGADWAVNGRPALGKEWSLLRTSGSSYFDNPILELRENDGDSPLELTLSGIAVSNFDRGGTSFPLTLQGRPDALAAAAFLPEDPVSVITPFWFPLTKPLGANATAVIFSAIAPIQLIPTFEEGFIVGFGTSQVLPYSFQLVIEFLGKDYVNFSSPALVAPYTEPSFGTLLDGSFSSNSREGLSGGTLLALDGQPYPNTVLQADIGEQVILRVPARPQAQTLRFDARIFTDCEREVEPAYNVYVRPLLIGSEHSQIQPSHFGLGQATSEISLAEGTFLIDTTAQEITLPLGGPATADVVLVLQGSAETKFHCVRTGALLDNVRLE